MNQWLFTHLRAHFLRCLLLLPIIATTGCASEEKSLSQVVATARTTGRAAATTQLRTDFYAKHITASGAIDLAHQRLDQAPDATSLTYAGAVLDFVDQVEPDIEKAGVNEFFWTRVGTLAGKAAAIAKSAGNAPEARSLVLAGPKRWQNEAFWRLHPDHDALASMIMFENNEGDAAVARLRERADLTDDQQKLVDQMEKDLRRGKGRG